MEFLAIVIRAGKEIKGTQVGKEKVKLSLLADDMVLCIENSEGNTKKMLELFHKFIKLKCY